MREKKEKNKIETHNRAQWKSFFFHYIFIRIEREKQEKIFYFLLKMIKIWWRYSEENWILSDDLSQWFFFFLYLSFLLRDLCTQYCYCHVTAWRENKFFFFSFRKITRVYFIITIALNKFSDWNTSRIKLFQ
jgi:hypothetical protein